MIRGEEFADRLGHNVGGAVAEDEEAVGVVVGGGEDSEFAIAGQRPLQVDHLAFAVSSDAAGDRGAGESGADHRGDIGRRRSVSDV